MNTGGEHGEDTSVKCMNSVRKPFLMAESVLSIPILLL